MNRVTRPLAALALVVGLVALVTPREAGAQPRGPQPQQQPQLIAIPGGGTELFRAFLDREGIKPVTANELNNMFAGSNDLIVIVIGSPHQVDWNRDPLRWVRQTVNAHGAALIATDQWVALHASSQNPNFHQAIGTFNGNDVIANFKDCHRGMTEGRTDTPYVVPISPDELKNAPEKPGRVWGVFRGLKKLATNKPTYIQEPFQYRGEYQYPLARLPKSSMPAWGGRFNQPPLFAVGGDGPGGRFNGHTGEFLAIADSSVYINQMIMETEADNLEFTLRTIEYLQGPEKHRKKCVFFENGKVVERFDELRQSMVKPKPKIPPEAVPNVGPIFGKNQDKLVDLGNDLADHFQKKDGLHNMFVGREGSEQEKRAFAWWMERAAVALAVIIAFVLLRRTLSARHATDLPQTPTTGAGAASTGPPGVFDRRQKELVRRNNLYEPVRNLMREFFDKVGAPENPGPRIPPLHISKAVRKPESLRHALRDMWRIAYGPPVYISAQRWFELEPYFERLRQAHADGKWRFETGEVPA
jgi:hypothetical protein